MEAFCNMLKSLFEKHLIPTITGLVVGEIIFVITPEDNAILVKVGDYKYTLLCAGIVFLLVELIWRIYRKCKKAFSEKQQKETLDQKMEKSEMEKLWGRTDAMAPSEIAYIEEFLRTDNEPIAREDYPSNNGILFGSRDCTVTREIIKDGVLLTEYKLETDFFESLKKSKRKYNRISHFK